MDYYSFGYPKQCTRCASFSQDKPKLGVLPYFKEGGDPKLMLIGQDPTIRRQRDRVRHVLMLDQPNSQLSRWLREEVFGKNNFSSLTLYAANLVKCSFKEPPSTVGQGGLRFIQPYFENCEEYLFDEISKFQPMLVLTLGEPTHKLFTTTLDNRDNILDRMKDALTGKFVRAKFSGIEFDYSPCLHIQTFRVAETYGDRLKRWKGGLAAYFKEAGDDGSSQ